MKKILVLLMALLILTSSVVSADDKLTMEDKINGYDTVMQLIDMFGITERTHTQILKSALLKLSDDDETYYKVLNAIAQSIDENSYYYSPEEYAKFLKEYSGVIGGIGVMATVNDGYFEVVEVLSDGAAKENGIVPGDRVIEADGVSLTGAKASVATDYITGEVGTYVTIKVLKKDGTVVPLTLERREITVTSADYSITEDNIAYLQILSFTDKTTEEVEKILKELKEKNVEKIIIDLRNNGGGVMDSGINTAALFMDKGETIISTKTNDENEKPTVYTTIGDGYNFKLAILVNKYTASASEIMSCALKENNHAVIVGEKTYGKASAQSVFPLSIGGGLRVTTMHYFTPLGNDIDKTGIEPNHKVLNTKFNYDSSQAPKLTYLNKYQVGDSTDEVEGIEKMLYDLNFLSEKPDNIYDQDTENAVYNFQKVSGLYPYGVCDLTTQSYLFNKYIETDFYNDDQFDFALDYLKNN